MSERVAVIEKLRKSGKTYVEIGQELGLSKQRVHQLYKTYIPTKSSIVRKVRYEQRNMCASCGATDNIQVHHKNGIKIDNRLENLVALCRWCHAEKDTLNRRVMPEKAYDCVNPLLNQTCLSCHSQYRTRQLRKRCFCSQECKDKFVKVSYSCLACGAQKTVQRGVFRRQGGRYCSKACFFKEYCRKGESKFKRRVGISTPSKQESFV